MYVYVYNYVNKQNFMVLYKIIDIEFLKLNYVYDSVCIYQKYLQIMMIKLMEMYFYFSCLLFYLIYWIILNLQI